MSTAHARVRAFLENVHGKEIDDSGSGLSVDVADLRILVIQAEALHHAAPQAAQIIEASA